jgi:UDP-N-acetylglucosamine 2-epimerase (non-hydrolysing)
LRYNTERPETVSSGGNILVGSDMEAILENANKILNIEEFANKMKNAKNPYGDGDASRKILDAIEKCYNEGLLDMKTPEDIMSTFSRKIAIVEENITVDEFERKNNALIKMVYSNFLIKFPKDNLNLKDMMVVYDLF